jgi:hypothetical protein
MRPRCSGFAVSFATARVSALANRPPLPGRHQVPHGDVGPRVRGTDITVQSFHDPRRCRVTSCYMVRQAAGCLT